MKVDNPRFNLADAVYCVDCPLHEMEETKDACYPFLVKTGLINCPTAETYAEACELAEKEATHAER